MKRYATLDTASAPAHIELQQGGLIATCDTDGTSSDRNARGTQVLSGERWAWECAAWGTEALTGTNVAFGLLQTSVANNVRVGNVTGSVAYTPGDGGIWVDGAKVATVAAAGAQRVVQFAIDLVATTPTLQLLVNNLALYTWTLSAGQQWLPAISVGVATAYGLSAYANFGARALDNAPPANYKPGIYINSSSGAALFFSSSPYRSPPSGSPANQPFAGRILDPLRFYVESGVSFWTDGQVGASWGSADLDIANADGAYDYLLKDQPRDLPVQYYVVDLDDAAGVPVLVATTRVDRIEQPSADVLRIKQRSALSIYEAPLQRKFIYPWADAGVANRVWPIALGACRNVSPVLVDQVNRTYLIHDAPLTAIGIARDKGDPLDPTVDPPDYTPTGDLLGIVPHVLPVGKFVADVSSTGESRLVPVSPTDLLGGVGAMTTATAGTPPTMPAAWTNTTVAGTSDVSIAWASTDGGRMRITWGAFWQGQPYQMGSTAATRTTVAITATNRYRIAIDIKNATRGPHYAGGQFSVVLIDSGGAAHTVPQAMFGSLDVGHYQADFTASVAAVALEMRFVVFADGGTASSTTVIDVDNIVMTQLPSAPGVNVTLAGMTWQNYIAEIVQYRFGGKTTDWVAADAAAIDAAKPYPFGVVITDAITTMAALNAPLDSFCAAYTQDEQGRLRIAMLQDPASMPASVSLTYVNLDGVVVGGADEAKGLTLAAGARHNWTIHTDADFVADFNPATGIDAATRTRFKRQSQFVLQSSASPHPLYQFAQGAKELNTLLDIPAHAQANMDSIAPLFAQARVNYTPAFFYAWPQPQVLRPGMAINITAPRGDFVGGKNLYIKRVRHYPMACRYELTAWG